MTLVDTDKRSFSPVWTAIHPTLVLEKKSVRAVNALRYRSEQGLLPWRELLVPQSI
jgi:hypothetical protein